MPTARFALLSLVACSAVSTCASPPTVDVQAEIQAIREMDLAWQSAYAAKNVEESLHFLAPDVVSMGEDSPAIVGLEAHRAMFEARFAMTGLSTTWAADVIEVAASGDLAYYRGTFHFIMQTPEGPAEGDGKFLAVCKKIDGEWKIIAESTTSDPPVSQE